MMSRNFAPAYAGIAIEALTRTIVRRIPIPQLNLLHGHFGSSTMIHVGGVLTNWTGNSQGTNLATNLDNDGDTDNADADGLVNQHGFVNIADLIAAANDELAAHSTASSGTAWRTYQEALKITLDGMNNNLSIFAL